MRFNCHTHIFNLRSVFTKETVHILIGKLTKEKLPPFVVKAVEKAVLKHLKGDTLDEDTLMREFLGAAKVDSTVKGLIKRGELALPPGLAVALEGDVAELPAEAVRDAIGKLGRLFGGDADEDARQVDIGDIIGFLGIGIKPSIVAVAEKLIKDSGDDTTVVPLMMDITEGGDADDERFRQQIEDTAEAVRVFPGRILPFVAVNPRRRLHFERMTYALEERGFVGVKLYPSLGYKIDSPEMRRVYKYCVEHDTPCMMHCTSEGFSRTAADGEECNPKHWDALLRDFPGLRICFGHFGGDEYLSGAASREGSWTDKIISLMNEHPGYVYADIAFHSGPMCGIDREEMYFARMRDLLSDPATGPYILFGSDFPMVRQRLREDSYWRYFEARFSKAEFKQITETNPPKYLGLPRSDGKGARENIVRHLRYLAKCNFGVRRQPADWVLSAIGGTGLGAVTFHPNEFGSDWTENNEAHFYLAQFFRRLMASSDAASLRFSQVGGQRMRDLANWPSVMLPNDNRQEALFEIARGLQDFLTQAPQPAAVLEKDVTSASARKELIKLLSDPDTRVANFGPAVDSLYRFKSESALS